MIASWQSPNIGGGISEELLLEIDHSRNRRVLIIPAMFDEANKLRRFTVQVMRALDRAGVDSFLPDMPGCNESMAALDSQTLAGWRGAADAAANHVGATHCLAIRAGALIAPAALPGWHYAPQTGAKVLRAMLRARIIAAREAGQDETSEQLLELGRRDGLILSGWPIGAEMVCELETAEPAPTDHTETIAQTDLGGAGLWLRAEPGENDAQSAALAAIAAGEGSAPE